MLTKDSYTLPNDKGSFSEISIELVCEQPPESLQRVLHDFLTNTHLMDLDPDSLTIKVKHNMCAPLLKVPYKPTLTKRTNL